MSAPEPNIDKIANYTETISTTVTNLLTELVRSSTASRPAPAPSVASIDDVLRLLQIMSLEIASIRNDVIIIKIQMIPSHAREDPVAGTPPSPPPQQQQQPPPPPPQQQQQPPPPPPGQQPPPSGQQPPPAGQQPPPQGQQPPPAGQQPPPQGQQPPAAGQQPPPQGQQPPPAGQQQTPAGQQQTPAGQQQPPAGQQAPPVCQQAPPAGQQQPPAGQQPPPQGQQPRPPPQGQQLQQLQPKIDAEPNFVEVLGLAYACKSKLRPETTEELNELARRYNSRLRDPYDFLVPLFNKNDKEVFGFPTTLGELRALDPKAESLLCGAFGIRYQPSYYGFASFCGCDLNVLENLCHLGITGPGIATARMLSRSQRAQDVQKFGDPTPESRSAAALRNRAARKRNACVEPSNNGISPLRDERNLEIPGFPMTLEWLANMQRKDVLWLLGEYGLDDAPAGCMARFEEFIGLPVSSERQRGLKWLL